MNVEKRFERSSAEITLDIKILASVMWTVLENQFLLKSFYVPELIVSLLLDRRKVFRSEIL